MARLFQSLLYGERQYWPAFMAGIVTHTECRNFLLARANTLAEDFLGYSPDFVESTLKLTTAFEVALFLPQ